MLPSGLRRNPSKKLVLFTGGDTTVPTMVPLLLMSAGLAHESPLGG